ncbi:hypothetical protein VN12_19955 [Pirellula sp. SH-Sr6A]|uniref:HEAT repeat domain-containing protein n=1 Tax=Pirellula sp. SH-Sr6A TaxID=1632865 RepID=UPI00078C3885|nr:HEAT repeat domain-containing protein [Pirellula sp. SH-Sr6A]AMV34409.1 hypothetical protein VN12_19955 [Pirellula sp. SH-Sr6A]
MEIDPFESSDEAHLWSLRVFQKLETATRVEGTGRSEFPDPDSPFWSFAVARELTENWEHYSPDLRPTPQGPQANQSVDLTDPDDASDASLLHQPNFGALEKLLHKLAQWLRQSVAAPLDSEEAVLRRLVAVQCAAELYLKIRHGRFTRVEGALLQVPFASGHSTAIRMGIDLLLQQPPDAWTSASLALSPLLQIDDWDTSIVFPRVFDTANPSILSSALDIANHLFTQRKVDSHPAKERYPLFVKLLGEMVQRLGVLEENPSKFGDSAESIQRILFDSVSLCVSLCHTMSAIGDASCIGKLNQALELKHRRIRTEAAFALGKLGEQHGIDALVEMAIDPAVRTRVLAYSEELGCIEKIDEQYRSILALAESQLAQWLAQVENMGLPPTRLELLEQRTLPWPGFESPQECFLFRFGYGMRDSEFSNVGFAGPTSKAFSQDLANVSMDDAFAIFAGWDIEHPEAYETPADRLSTSDEATMMEWGQMLQPDKFEVVEPAFLAHFFGNRVLVGMGEKGGRKQPFAFDGKELVTLPSLAPSPDALTLTYYLWRGREFFHTFA